jgi:hypothetical protein
MRWKERSTARSPAAPAVGDCPVWADGPNAELSEAPADQGRATANGLPLGLWPDEDDGATEAELPDDACLADRLCAAREWVERACASDQRSRAALYRALGQAYDFALAAEDDTDSYAELLDDAGLKIQARAPMTPIVKLVFGAAYDKTRLTEFRRRSVLGQRENSAAGNARARCSRTLTAGSREWSRPSVAPAGRHRDPIAPPRSGTGFAPCRPSPMSRSRCLIQRTSSSCWWRDAKGAAASPSSRPLPTPG